MGKSEEGQSFAECCRVNAISAMARTARSMPNRSRRQHAKSSAGSAAAADLSTVLVLVHPVSCFGYRELFSRWMLGYAGEGTGEDARTEFEAALLCEAFSL